jgi:hypothetical protein
MHRLQPGTFGVTLPFDGTARPKAIQQVVPVPRPRFGHASPPAPCVPLRHGLLPGIIHPWQAKRLSQRRRNPGVAFGVHMETVLAPESWVGADRVCGKVDEAGASGSSGLADGVIHGPDSGSQVTADRHDAGEVRERESQYDCVPADECPHHALEFCPQLAGIESAFENVIRARENRREVGLHGERWSKLLLADVPGALAAHTQVGVEQPALRLRHALGQTVRPATVTARPIRVLEPLGGTVTNRDVALESERHDDIVRDGNGARLSELEEDAFSKPANLSGFRTAADTILPGRLIRRTVPFEGTYAGANPAPAANYRSVVK